MYWNKNFSSFELIFLLVFVIIYCIYIAKVIYIAIKLKIPANGIFIKLGLRLLIVACFVAALLQPYLGNLINTKNEASKNKLVIFLVDVSMSMTATDQAPTRLTKAKHEIENILKQFPTLKVACIAFNAESFLICPFTSDHEAFTQKINQIDTNLGQFSGTNLTGAIDLALEKIIFKNTHKNTAAGIVVFTDGEDFGEINDNTIEEIRRRNINMILVGLGTTQGSNLYNKNSQKPIVSATNGKIVKSKLEEDYLLSLAKVTNGKYISMNQKDALSTVFLQINSLKNTYIGQIDNFYNTNNKYYLLVALGILFIIFDFIFSVKIFQFI